MITRFILNILEQLASPMTEEELEATALSIARAWGADWI